MAKINIFIIENESSLVEHIKIQLEQSFTDFITVFPKFINETTDDLDSKNFLMHSLEKGLEGFPAVLEYCLKQPIHFFVIDIRLLNDGDELGLKFAEYLLANYKVDFTYKVIIMSNFYTEHPIFKLDNVEFMKKFDGEEFIPLSLTEKIHGFLKNKGAIAEDATLPSAVTENSAYNKHKLSKETERKRKKSLDLFIQITFYSILSLLLINAILGIGCFLINVAKHEITELHSSNSNPGLDADMIILKITEHVFLYLLPLFITFGFMNYYINNISINLLGGEINSTRSKNSTSTIDLTKIMFISSIISYIIIKIIELVCGFSLLDLDKFYCLLALLLILIFYLFLLYRNHKSNEH